MARDSEETRVENAVQLATLGQEVDNLRTVVNSLTLALTTLNRDLTKLHVRLASNDARLTFLVSVVGGASAIIGALIVKLLGVSNG